MLKSFLFSVLAILNGMLLPTKSGCDIRLTQFIGDPIVSTCIVTTIGAVFLTPSIWIAPKHQRNAFKVRERLKQMDLKHEWALFLSGPLGTIYTIISICVTTKIGFSLFFICMVFGQICTSFVIDLFGFVWCEQKKFSLWNKAAIPLLLVGVVIFQLNDYLRDEYTLAVSVPMLIVYSFMAAIAGSMWVLVTAFNERLDREYLGTPYRATVLGYYMDALCGGLLILITHFWPIQLYSDDNVIQSDDAYSLEWWYFIGGVLGILYVIATVISAERIGCSPTYIGVTVGFLVMSLMFDAFGVFGVEQQPVTWNKVVGMALIFISSVLISVDWSRFSGVWYRAVSQSQADQSRSMIAESMHCEETSTTGEHEEMVQVETV